MKQTTTEFLHVESIPTPSDTMAGHITTVTRRPTPGGFDMAEKSPNSTNDDDMAVWMDKNIHARTASDAIRAVGNNAYIVPRTFISHGHVRDQWAPGERLCDIGGSDYIKKNLDKFIPSMAAFINDMSELHPTQYTEFPPQMPGLWFLGVNNLTDILHRFDGIVSDADQTTLIDTYKYIRNLPENKIMVFSHGDLNTGNIFIDRKTNRVAIIDFEYAGFESQFVSMYAYSATAVPDLWDYINHMPRTQNPNLKWEFDTDKFGLYRQLRAATGDITNFPRLTATDAERDELAKNVHRMCNLIRFHMGNLNARMKSNHTAPATTIVPMSHYDR